MTYQRVTFSGTIDFKLETPTPGLEAETTAWVAAVVGNGGTVSDQRKTLVNALIVSLKADGIWTKLDRLWLFAAEDEESALTDLVGLDLATAVNSPSFSADAGYTGDGATSYINSNFNPVADGVNYTQNSASIGGWVVNSRTTNGNRFLGVSGATGTAISPLNNGLISCFVNATAENPITMTNAQGFSVGSRTAASLTTTYKDGSALAPTSSNTAGSMVSDNFYLLGQNVGGPSSLSTDQIALIVFGGGLDATENANLYTHLQTYMTAVGL